MTARPSSDVYRRLLRGEADVKEYTAALRKESREAVKRILERGRRAPWERKP